MSNAWRVYRTPCTGGWVAQQYSSDLGYEFTTCATAIRFADKQARKEEVQLPRPSTEWEDRIPGTDFALVTDPNGVCLVYIDDIQACIAVAHDELKPLAEALLALHYKAEKEALE
nr:MAG TPA: hypothetical protein [Caudoviricetes sp.]